MTTSNTLGAYFRVRKEKGEPELPTLSVTVNDGLVDRSDLDRKMETNLSPEQHLRVREGDIAYNMMRMWQGAFGRAGRDGIVSPAYVVVEPRKDIDSRFAAHWFKSARMIYLFRAYSYGLTEDRLRLYPDAFCQIPASPPPMPEQKRIADILDSWDRSIVQIKELLTAKRGLHSGLCRTIFAPAIHEDVDGESDWELCPVSAIAEVVGGGTPPTSEAAYWGGDVPWCTPTDLTGLVSRYISSTERTITSAGLKVSSATLLPPDSIVLCSRASVGECGINKVPMSTNQSMESLVPHESRDTLFIYYLVRTFKRRLLRISVGSTFRAFTRTELSSMIIAAPPPEQRVQIGKTLANLDNEIDALRGLLARIELQKRALIQRISGCSNLVSSTEAAE